MSITDVLVEDPDAMTAAEDPHPEPSKLRHWIGVVAPPLAVAALVIGAWYFGTYVLRNGASCCRRPTRSSRTPSSTASPSARS